MSQEIEREQLQLPFPMIEELKNDGDLTTVCEMIPSPSVVTEAEETPEVMSQKDSIRKKVNLVD